MYDLQIRKGGSLISQEWDPIRSKFVEREIDPKDFMFHFNDIVCLATGVTLKDIFLFIERAPGTIAVITGCPFLNELITEALSNPTHDDKEIVALELKRIAVVHKSNLFFHFDFHGLGEKEYYAIEFTPINELITQPLILNEDIALESGDTEEIYFKCKMGFKLIDVLTGIIEELSAMGPPNVRSMALEEIKRRADEFKEGKIETTSWEEIRKKLEKEADKDMIPCKICGKDARAQCFDKPPDICVACFERIKEN